MFQCFVVVRRSPRKMPKKVRECWGKLWDELWDVHELEQLVSKELSERVSVRKASRRTIPREVAAMATATDCQRFGSRRRPQQSEFRYGHSAGEAGTCWDNAISGDFWVNLSGYKLQGIKVVGFCQSGSRDGFVQK